MGPPGKAAQTWRFGAFELDASTAELRRAGKLIRLQELPSRILLLLLEHAGELVSREQLRQRLWPSDTFVDFDRGLNTAVMKLREALGDSADRPLYIETVPRKGYRFVAPVLEAPGADAVPASGMVSASPAALPIDGVAEAESNLVPATAPTILTDATPVKPKPSARSRWTQPRILVPVFLVSILLVLAGVLWTSRRTSSNILGEKNEAQNLRIVPITIGEGDLHSPAFSPYGREIAFVWKYGDHWRGDLYVQLVGGETPLRIVHNEVGFLGQPQWSPDGREIAFTWCARDEEGVYVVSALGGPVRKLTDVDCRYGRAGTPIWTPDGRSLLLVDRCTPGGPEGLVLFFFASGEKRCLTAPRSPTSSDFADALSPDGRTVAFLVETSAHVSELYTVPLSGGTPKPLTSEDHSIASLMWTRDGHSIVFDSDRGVLAHIWRVPARGGRVDRDLVFPAIGTFSGDGQRFAYAQPSLEEHAIWRTDLSGPGGRVVSTRKFTASQDPEDGAQISPDGSQVVLQSGRTGPSEIWLSRPDRENLQPLTSLGRFSGTPRWSADGKWIAFDSRPKQYSQIHIVDAEGRRLHMITGGNYDNVVPSWSRDGKYIYYASMRSGEYQVWKHSLTDGSERQLTQNGGFAPMESSDGETLYYSKFHEAGLWRMPVNGGPESLVVAGKPQIGFWGAWAVTDKGIYVLDANAQPRPMLQYYSFATKKLNPVMPFEKSPCPWDPSLSASHDGRTLFYTQCDTESEIRMMENFR